MGDLRPVEPVLLICAAFSRHAQALDWACERLTQIWGPIALASERFEFVETDYYAATMGPGIHKCFWAFDRPFDPAQLPACKLAANDWEAEYTRGAGHAEPRPLNLDPGYMTPAKLVLASTKDHAHRLYLDRGIFGEVTLFFKDRRWQHRDWTFPDYRRADYQAFFLGCRQLLRDRQRHDDRYRGEDRA